MVSSKNITQKEGPRVSVVIPCYNHGHFIVDTIESVRAQAYPNIEIIVVNDGSSDPETIGVFKTLPEDICLIEQPNKGLASARNRGIETAKGEYILPLDADDRISAEFIQRTVEVMEADRDVGIVYGLTQLFGAKSGLWPQPAYSMPDMLFENMIVATALYRKSDWERIGGYRPEMRYAWEDWDFWLALVALGVRVVRLENVTFYYRITDQSMTRRLSFSQKLSMFSRLILRHKKLYLTYPGAVLRRLLSPSSRVVCDPRQ
ncbi:MAG: glycosyltransferase family 2 protein [Desulfuromonas sp.]|nr:MAG: glycosyltransferase family 2 protein [Desulfuromonas sp.]